MARRICQFLLALLLCGLTLVAIDMTCHGAALYRLENRKVGLASWRYRVVDRAAESPEDLGLFYDSRSRFTLWRQHMIAHPDRVIVTNMKLDESMTRDLAVTRMADLCLQDCTGLTPAVMTEISGISTIRELEVSTCEVTDEAFNLVWSRLPNLEHVDVCYRLELPGVDQMDLTNRLLTEAGFRDIKQAKKLKRLDLHGEWQSIDQVIARVSEAPALERLIIEDGKHMEEASAERLASMPALREVKWVNAQPRAAFVARLKALQPRLKLISIHDTEL
jgi:hypothetical protein